MTDKPLDCTTPPTNKATAWKWRLNNHFADAGNMVSSTRTRSATASGLSGLASCGGLDAMQRAALKVEAHPEAVIG